MSFPSRPIEGEWDGRGGRHNSEMARLSLVIGTLIGRGSVGSWMAEENLLSGYDGGLCPPLGSPYSGWPL